MSDGELATARAQRITVVLPEPLVADAGDDQVAVPGAELLFDASGSRPDALISDYTWDFGDGSTGDGKQARHVFDEPGTYTVTATAISGSEEDTDTATVTVKEETVDGVVVAVTGGGTRLDGAAVALIDDTAARYGCITGSAGDCVLAGVPDGRWAVYAYAQGYAPKEGLVTVEDGSGATDIALEPGAAAQVALTSRPLTLDEIVEYGIDPDDPANQNAKVVTINLGVSSGGGGTSFTGVASSSGWSGARSYTGGGYRATPTVKKVGDNLSVFWMIVPAKATWLKEFFQVTLLVQNISPPAFTLTDGSATLNLPAGLSLAPTAQQQSRTRTVPDIAGGAEANVDWIIRGDKKGSYEPTADYTALLDPVGAALALRAELDEPIKVWGEDAIEMTVTADNQAFERHPYNMEITLENVADVPAYNLGLNVDPGDGSTYIHQPRAQLDYQYGTLAPGETRTASFTLIPRGSGYLDIARGVRSSITGTVTPRDEIQFRPPAQTPVNAPDLAVDTSVRKTANLTWDPIPGATEYRVFATSSPGTPFGTDPMLIADGGTRSASVPIEDGQQLHFAISSIVDGRPSMWHPLTSGTGTLGSPPALEVTEYWSFGPHQQLSDGDLIDVGAPNQPDTSVLRIVATDADGQIPDIQVEIQPTDGRATPSTECFEATVEDQQVTRECWVRSGSYAEDLSIVAADADGQKASMTIHVGTRRGDVNGDGEIRWVVMGDSYISGEGFEDYFKDENGNEQYATDAFGNQVKEYEDGTDYPTNHCHRAVTSWAVQVANKLGAAGDDLAFFACSGAVTDDVLTKGQHPQSPDDIPGGRPQIRELREFHGEQAVDGILIGIGGNDAEFASIVQDCVLPSMRLEASISSVSKSVSWWQCDPELAGDIETRVRNTLLEVKKAAPGARVLVSTYPDQMNSQNDQCLAIGAAGREDVGRLRAFIGELNATVSRAAAAAGVDVLDFEDEFADRGICDGSGTAFVHGLKAGADVSWKGVSVGLQWPKVNWVTKQVEIVEVDPGITAVPFAQESFHPTVAGHQHLAKAALADLVELLRGAPPSGTWDAGYIDVDPYSGLATSYFGTPGGGTDMVVQYYPAQNQLIKIGTYSVPTLVNEVQGIAGEPIDVGGLLPPSLAPGWHLIELRDSETGERLAHIPYIVAPDGSCEAPPEAPDADGDGYPDECDLDNTDGPLADVDGDGVVNGEDLCPVVADPDQSDVDGDFEGDACDGDQGADPFAGYQSMLRTLSGTVTDGDGPVSDVLVEVLDPDSGTPLLTTTTDADGSYALTPLLVDRLKLRASADGEEPGYYGGDTLATATVIDVAASESAVVALHLERTSPRDTSPPIVRATVQGTQGTNGWYISGVQVTWSISDSESDVESTDGCDPVTVDTDNPGLNLTCTATSAGGTTTESLTIKRDATAPVLTCPIPEPTFEQGAAGAELTAGVSDEASGAAVDQIAVPVDTLTPGSKSVEVDSVDRAGNEATATCGFTVATPPAEELARVVARVFGDANGDLKPKNESGLQGATVEISNSSGLVGSATTGPKGYVTFSNLPAPSVDGEYTVSVTSLPEGYALDRDDLEPVVQRNKKKTFIPSTSYALPLEVFVERTNGNVEAWPQFAAVTSEACESGTFSSTGQAPCTPSPPGMFVADMGATQATPCPAGSYQPLHGQAGCLPADPGNFVDVVGSIEQSRCELGFYQDLAGQTTCIEADVDFIVDAVGAAQQQACPAGTTTNGQTGQTECVAPAPECTIEGTDEDDVLRGTRNADVICGYGGDDRLYGLDGADILIGGPGNDVLLGGRGDDELNGGDGHDRLYGWLGNDILNGGNGRDRLWGFFGDDTLDGGEAFDRCVTGRGNDITTNCER